MTDAASIPTDITITLVSNDDKKFVIPRNAIRRAGTIENLIQDLKWEDGKGEIEPIPLPDIDGKTLELVAEYCKHHIDEPIFSGNEDEPTKLSDWVNDFLDVDQQILYDLLLAANYLDIKSLVHEICQTVADMIRGKSTDDIRRIYGIKNDFTEEEEDQVKKENAWCNI